MYATFAYFRGFSPNVAFCCLSLLFLILAQLVSGWQNENEISARPDRLRSTSSTKWKTTNSRKQLPPPLSEGPPGVEDANGLNNSGGQLSAQKALNRTLAKIRSATENGRLILLTCKIKCLKQRNEIPRWIREFGTVRNSSAAIDPDDDDVRPPEFHFHFYRLPLKFGGVNRRIRHHSTDLLYAIGDRTFPFDGDLQNKSAVWKWLAQLEEPSNLVHVSSADEFNRWISAAAVECRLPNPQNPSHSDNTDKGGGGHQYEYVLESSANNNGSNSTTTLLTSGDTVVGTRKNNYAHQRHKVLLIIHSVEVCKNVQVKNLARLFSSPENDSGDTTTVTVVEYRRPIAAEAKVILYRRLQVVEYRCAMTVLLHNNGHIQLPENISLAEIAEFTRAWNYSVPCAMATSHDYRHNRPILPRHQIAAEQTEAELEFYMEELPIRRIESSRAFIIVGIIGGVSVVALAISIFWGLSGTSFVDK